MRLIADPALGAVAGQFFDGLRTSHVPAPGLQPAVPHAARPGR